MNPRRLLLAALLLPAACAVRTHASGLLPEQPPAPGFEADSLRPTLRWEAFAPPADLAVSDITYEVRLFTADADLPENAFYARTGLRDPRHTIETTLEPDRTYFWTVRARFRVDGRERHTQWSGFARPDARIALVPQPPPAYFPLRTPRP